MYTLREFRAKTKLAFDQAEKGPIYIQRSGKTFQLNVVAESIKLKGQVIEAGTSVVIDSYVPTAPAGEGTAPGISYPDIIKDPKDVKGALRSFEVCEHGAGERMCRVKKCRNYQFK